MEKNPVCRLCLKSLEQLSHLTVVKGSETVFRNIHEVNDDGTTTSSYIKMLIPELLYINVKEQAVCEICHTKLKSFFTFRQDCHRSLNLIKIAVGDSKQKEDLISLKNVVSYWKNNYNSRSTNIIMKRTNLKEWFGFRDETIDESDEDCVIVSESKRIKLDEYTQDIVKSLQKRTPTATDEVVQSKPAKHKVAVRVDSAIQKYITPKVSNPPENSNTIQHNLVGSKAVHMISTPIKPPIAVKTSNAKKLADPGRIKLDNNAAVLVSSMHGKVTITSQGTKAAVRPEPAKQLTENKTAAKDFARVQLVKRKPGSTKASTPRQSNNSVIRRVKLNKSKSVATSTEGKSKITRNDTPQPDQEEVQNEPLVISSESLDPELQTSLEEVSYPKKKIIKIGTEWFEVSEVKPIDTKQDNPSDEQGAVIQKLSSKKSVGDLGGKLNLELNYMCRRSTMNLKKIHRLPRVPHVNKRSTKPKVLRNNAQAKPHDIVNVNIQDEELSPHSVNPTVQYQSDGSTKQRSISGTTRTISGSSMTISVDNPSSVGENMLDLIREIKQEIDDASTSKLDVQNIKIKKEPLFYEDNESDGSNSFSENIDYDHPEYIEISTLPIISEIQSLERKAKTPAEEQSNSENEEHVQSKDVNEPTLPIITSYQSLEIKDEPPDEEEISNSENEEHVQSKYVHEPTLPIITSCQSLNIQDEPPDEEEIKVVNESDEEITIIPDQFETKNVSESSDNEVMNEKPDNARQVGRMSKCHCYLCGKKVVQFRHHLEKEHLNEPYVRQIFCLKPNSKKRIQLITKLRNQGAFVKKTTSEYDDSSPDIVKKNTGPTKPLILLSNDILNTSGFLKCLKSDDISRAGKSDPLICEVLRRFLGSKEPTKKLFLAATSHFRRLARLLIEIKKKSNFIDFNLNDILRPCYFGILIQATLEISEYDDEIDSVTFTQLACKMGTLIKKATHTAFSVEINKKEHCERKLANLGILIEKLETDWNNSISEAQHALWLTKQTVQTRSSSKVDDVKMFDEYLTNVMCTARNNLTANPTRAKLYHDLQESIFCRILIFNKRTINSLQELLLSEYFKNNTIASSDVVDSHLSKSEKIMHKLFDRIVMLNRNSRQFPILFDQETFENLNFLVNMRARFDLSSNPYVFGIIGGKQRINGYAAVKKHSTRALANESIVYSFVNHAMRNELATITQMLRMNSDGLEELSGSMGIDRQEFRSLPDSTTQIAKLSKLISNPNNFCYKKLKEVNLTPTENIEIQVKNEGNDVVDKAVEDSDKFDDAEDFIRTTQKKERL